MTVSWHQAFVVGAHLLLTWVLTTISIPASAAEPAKVRIAFDTDLPVWVGQKVAFHVDLMSATFFSGTPTFDLPDLPGVVLMKVEARPVVSTERVDGDTYSVQRHQFVLFPQQSGTIMVPPFQARFAVAPGFGRPPVEQALMTDTLMGEVRMPPGTAGLSMLISTTDLTVDDNAWRSCRTESPAASFARLQTACRSGNPAVAFNALMRWLDRTQAGAGVATVEQFVQETGDDELRAQAEKLQRLLFAPQSVANTIWSGHALYDRLAHVQKHRRHGQNSSVLQGRETLPTLNPASTP